MASERSAISRREPRRDSAIAESSFSRSGQQSQPASSSMKTRLPVLSQLTLTTTVKAPSKKHLHSRSLTVPTTNITKSPRLRSTPSNPKANNRLETSEASHRKPRSLFTPTSAKRQPGERSPASFQTPNAPRKEALLVEVLTIVTQSQTSTSPAKTPYLHAHIGDACIYGALVHQLRCGHKVMTRVPEQCKSNCKRPVPQYIEKYANTKDESKALVCAGCVEDYVEKHRQAKRVLFLENIEKIKAQMGGIPEGWIESQLKYWERVWENDTQKERTEFAKLGDVCVCIPGRPRPL